MPRRGVALRPIAEGDGESGCRYEDMDRLVRDEIWKQTGLMMLIFEALVAWVRECSDPGGGPEPEADYKPICEEAARCPG
jgi:hypothetical protein